MDYDMKYISWDKAKEDNNYDYNGNNNTCDRIADKFQMCATNKNYEERNIVSLSYYDYTCELDIFWEDIGIEDSEMKLVIELFITQNKGTLNNSEEILISDIYKKDYLENKMYEFILDSI